LIGIYKFYQNWSTETFRKSGLKKWAACYTKSEDDVMSEIEGYGLKWSITFNAKTNAIAV
jgi:hypothetical protein